MSDLHYDPYSEEALRDPYAIYKRLREEKPAYYIEEYDAWALSRFEDIWKASMDMKSYSVATAGASTGHLLTRQLPVNPSMMHTDPPDHTRLRSQIKAPFTKQQVATLEPAVRRIVRDQIGRIAERGEGDALKDISQPVATRVTCLVLDLPEGDAPQLEKTVDLIFAREPGTVGLPEASVAAFGELDAYFLEMIKERRRTPSDADDMLNRHLRVELSDRRPSDEEIAAYMTTLLIGGVETFPKVFAGGVVRLDIQRDQRTLLLEDPSLIPNAIDEIGRYELPLQMLGRTVIRDVEFHGEKLRAGQPVMFLYASAHRDEREFEDPDTFDVRRSIARVLTFGRGTHACIGQHIALLEGRILLEEMLAAMPDYEVDMEGCVTAQSEWMQGYLGVPIRFRPFSINEGQAAATA
jgi:cytochrome P450